VNKSSQITKKWTLQLFNKFDIAIEVLAYFFFKRKLVLLTRRVGSYKKGNLAANLLPANLILNVRLHCFLPLNKLVSCLVENIPGLLQT